MSGKPIWKKEVDPGPRSPGQPGDLAVHFPPRASGYSHLFLPWRGNGLRFQFSCRGLECLVAYQSVACSPPPVADLFVGVGVSSGRWDAPSRRRFWSRSRVSRVHGSDVVRRLCFGPFPGHDAYGNLLPEGLFSAAIPALAGAVDRPWRFHRGGTALDSNLQSNVLSRSARPCPSSIARGRGDVLEPWRIPVSGKLTVPDLGLSYGNL